MSKAYVPPAYRHRRVSGRGRALVWLLALGAVALEIAYPLVGDERRPGLTVLTVVVFFLASLGHAAVHRGPRWALGVVLVAGGGGLLAEAVGVRTGRPFGEYAYAGDLGPEVLDVPLVVPMAWAMMAYPALLVGRRLGGRRTAWPIGALALASWDLFLDPQMVAAGHWRWADPTPALPGIPGVPVTNFVGWALVSLAIVGVLHAALPQRRADDTVPALLYLWTYASSVLAAAVFFDRPSVALVGGVVMGAVALPYAISLWRARP